jgi:hypothetical protein
MTRFQIYLSAIFQYISFLTLLAMTEENFDRFDYEAAITLANQLLPVQPTESLIDVADNNIMVLWWV